MTAVTMLGNVLLVLAAIPAVAAALIYGFGVTWWRSRWGRHLATYMSAVAIVLVLGCLKLLIGDSPAFAATRTGAFGLVVIAFWWRLWFIVKALREGSPDDGKPLHHPVDRGHGVDP